MSGAAQPVSSTIPTTPNVDLLIRASVLTKGKVLEQRNDIWKSLVQAGLSQLNVGEEFSVPQLAEVIQRLSRCMLAEEAIVVALERLVEEGALRHREGLSYVVARKLTLPEFSQITQGAWGDFEAFLKAAKVDYDPFIDEGARPVFDQVILRILSRFVSSLSTETSPFDLLPIDDFKNLIESVVRLSALPERRKSPIAASLGLFLKGGSPSLKTLVYNCYTGLINIDIVRREQELPSPDFIDSLKFFATDTSFLVTLLCKSDPAHALALAVVREARRGKIPLHYPAETRAELNSLIYGTKMLAGSLSLPGHSGVLNNQFISDFRESGLDWPVYFAQLATWEATVGQWDIKPMPPEQLLDVDEPTYSLVRKMLPILDSLRNEERHRADPNHMPRRRMEEQFEHDSLCLGVLARHRAEITTQSGHSAMGPWFLTFDNLVTALNPYFQKELGLELVMQPRVALNYFLAYSKVHFNAEDRDEVAEALLRYTARTPQPRLSVSEYLRLLTYRVGLENSDVNVVQQIFLRHPLLEELERALNRERADEADEAAYKVITNDLFVRTIIEERRTLDRLRQAGQAVTAEREKALKERAAREALERVLNRPIRVSIDVNSQLTFNLKVRVEDIASLLDAEGAFSLAGFPKAEDLSSVPAVSGWLRRVTGWIESHPEVSDGIKAVVPIIGAVLSRLPH